jgi:hypothetical protein
MPIPVNMMTGAEASGIAAQVGQAASQSALNFAKVDLTNAQTRQTAAQTQSTYADINSKYADFFSKLQDIQTRDMEIDVLEAEQAGKLANARISSERNIALSTQLDNMKRGDAVKVQSDTVQAMSALQTNELQSMIPLSESVLDPKSHASAYTQAEQFLSVSGKKPEDIGITKQYQGKKTIDAWTKVRNSAISTQELLSAEKMENLKHRNIQDRDAVLQKYDLRRDFHKFAFENYLQEQRLTANKEIARVKAIADSGMTLKKSDYNTVNQQEATKTIVPQLYNSIAILRDEYENFEDLDAKDKTEIVGFASELVTEAMAEHDRQWVEYTRSNGTIAPPEPIDALIAKGVESFPGRVGEDGEIYKPNDKELLAQKQSWLQKAKNNPKAKAMYAKYPEEVVNDWLERGWSNPVAREQYIGE